MSVMIDHTKLHRTAKFFMDSGQAATLEGAMDTLRGFGLAVYAGPEIRASKAHQIALLSLVNLARRTFLGGVEVSGVSGDPLLVPLVEANSLSEAVERLGGKLVEHVNIARPAALIGSCSTSRHAVSWQLTWEGWRGGVVPARDQQRFAEDASNPLAPALAAAACGAELFAWYAKEHPMAGRRAAGISLWQPGIDWMEKDASEPALSYLPSRLWLIGLGNLGQAFAWLLACLPYRDRGEIELVLQDFDVIAESNDSTSLLSSPEIIGCKKTRAVGRWLERVGFSTTLEERRFGEWTQRASHEPGVAFCGVDNTLARAALGKAGFDLVVEAGLGAGPEGFRNFSMHTFPASRPPEEIWLGQSAPNTRLLSSLPAYVALEAAGLDTCGLAQLASRSVGVPFVGVVAAGVAVSELLRRLHGGESLELASGSIAALADLETVQIVSGPYAHGHVQAGETEP